MEDENKWQDAWNQKMNKAKKEKKKKKKWGDGRKDKYII